MNKNIQITASVFGATAVILGAFGAHALKGQVDANALSIWVKGVEYQFYHTFALLFLSQLKVAREVRLGCWFFSLGILFFSGSLYLLATRSILNIPLANYVGPITPIGGLFFILGWIMLFLSASKSK